VDQHSDSSLVHHIALAAVAQAVDLVDRSDGVDEAGVIGAIATANSESVFDQSDLAVVLAAVAAHLVQCDLDVDELDVFGAVDLMPMLVAAAADIFVVVVDLVAFSFRCLQDDNDYTYPLEAYLGHDNGHMVALVDYTYVPLAAAVVLIRVAYDDAALDDCMVLNAYFVHHAVVAFQLDQAHYFHLVQPVSLSLTDQYCHRFVGNSFQLHRS